MLPVARPSRVPRRSRLVRTLMLLLGIAATPSLGLEALQRSHCTQHEAGTHRAAAAAPAASTLGSPAWTEAHHHQCRHCPPSACAQVSSCAGGAATAMSSEVEAAVVLPGQAVALDLARDQADSTQYPPDTPPPQLIP